MKKVIGLVLLFTVSIISMIGLGKIVAYDWPEIEEDSIKALDYLDERMDDAIEIIEEKMVMVFDKD